MSDFCKNCGAVVDGNYCSNCGQPVATHNINTSFIVHDLQHGLIHINGGILHSARELFTRPGHSVREYIEGKRIKHYKPLSMLIVLAGFYILLYNTFDIHVFNGLDDETFNFDEANEWIIHHFSIITLLLLPILSLSSYIVFRKQGYNYTEHIILNSFYSCQKLWIRILTIPLLLWQDEAMTIMQVLMVADLMLMLWCYKQFFINMSMFKALIKTLMVYLIDLLLMVILLSLIFIIILPVK